MTPSLSAHSFLRSVHPRLDAPSKHLLARSAVFLALAQDIPPDFTPPDALGKELDDQEIIGSELYDLVRAELNHRAGKTLDDAAYRDSFSLHFEFGCQRL